MNITCSNKIPLMLRFVIVDDSEKDGSLLRDCLIKFTSSNGDEVSIALYTSPLEALSKETSGVDAFFLDVEMPLMDGFELARRIRKNDQNVAIVFVTNVYSMAVNGYEVDAIDYILKPINYLSFSLKMERFMRIVKRKRGSSLVLKTKSELLVINQSDIIYIEVRGHSASIHTNSEVISVRISLAELASKLDSTFFSKCNNCYLVNLSYVKKVVNHDLYLKNGDVLQISFPRKNEFVSSLTSFLGGNKK